MTDTNIGTATVSVDTEKNSKELWELFRNTSLNKDDERLEQFEKRSVRDPITGRIKRGPTDDDTALMVTFSMERVFSKFETFKNNGEPTYLLKEFITIIPPGQEKELTRHSLVEDIDKWRFPREYERFKKGLDTAVEGTKLSTWKPMVHETALIREFEQIGIHTVEQLASTSDQDGNRHIRSFLPWKAQARKWMEANIKSDATVDLEKSVEDIKAAHKREIDAMNEKLERMMKLLEGDRLVSAPVGLPTKKKSSYTRKELGHDPE